MWTQDQTLVNSRVKFSKFCRFRARKSHRNHNQEHDFILLQLRLRLISQIIHPLSICTVPMSECELKSQESYIIFCMRKKGSAHFLCTSRDCTSFWVYVSLKNKKKENHRRKSCVRIPWNLETVEPSERLASYPWHSSPLYILPKPPLFPFRDPLQKLEPEIQRWYKK